MMLQKAKQEWDNVDVKAIKEAAGIGQAPNSYYKPKPPPSVDTDTDNELDILSTDDSHDAADDDNKSTNSWANMHVDEILSSNMNVDDFLTAVGEGV